ncbi:MAG: hypothetical protein WCS42_27510 [Verrucomicrobiota bacterium]
MSDILDAEQLGAERDVRAFPIQKVIPWAEGDEPFGESLDLNEYPVELLRLTKCRSFRADLLHKLTIILRAHGGSGRGGITKAAKLLRVDIRTFGRWLRWEQAPCGRCYFEHIDNTYAEAIELLVAGRVKKKRRRKPEQPSL